MQSKDTGTCPQEYMALQNSKNEKLWSGANQYSSAGEQMCGFRKMEHYYSSQNR